MSMDIDAAPSSASDDERPFGELFVGNIDVLESDVVSGWVAAHDPRSDDPIVSLSIDGRKVGETPANRHRPDLESAGLRSGNCAFELALPPYAERLAGAGEGRVRVEVSCGDDTALMHEGSLGRAGAVAPVASRAVADSLGRFILRAEYAAGAEAREDADVVRSSARRAACAPGSPLGAIYAPARTRRDGGDGRAYLPSAFVAFTRDRMRMHHTFDYAENPWEADELLLWYLEWYGLHRRPLRAPLARQDIARCNELVAFPRCAYRISRFHHAYLLKHRPETRLHEILNDEGKYVACLFDWVTRVCAEFGVGDVLVPDSYVSTLRAVPGQWKGKDFPLNRFFGELIRSRSDASLLDLTDPGQRAAIYLCAYVDSSESPTLFHYIPPAVRTALFERAEGDGRTTYRRLAESSLSADDIDRMDRIDMHGLLSTALLEKAYDAGALRHLTVGADGHRHHCGNMVVPPSEGGDRAVQLVGPLNKTSGLGQAARLSATTLERSGFDVRLVDFDLDNPAPVEAPGKLVGVAPVRADINLIHLNAEALPLLAAYTPDVWADSYNIGYFFWELDSPARCHSLAMDMLDEIWVSSEFGVSQYQPHCDLPVTNVGMAFEETDLPDRDACRARLSAEFGIEAHETVFLATFDSFSFVQRKNPRAVIDAFQQAFAAEEPVRLVIKTQNRDSVVDPAQHRVWRAIDALVADDPRITLVNQTLSYSDLMWFKGAMDCYVSLHRSEGWGFGMLEAMSIGVPVIASNYSGNLEFCKPEHCWLVSGERRFLESDDYIFVEPGQSWFDPHVEDAARCMREAFDDPAGRKAVGMAGREYVREHFSHEAIARRYESRIDDIRRRRSADVE